MVNKSLPSKDNQNSSWGEQDTQITLEDTQITLENLRLEITKSHRSHNNGQDEEKGLDLEQFLRDGQLREAEFGKRSKRIGVVFKNLTVKGVDSGSSHVKTFATAVWRTVSGQELVRMADWMCRGNIPFLPKPKVRNILTDFNGYVRPGEMLLVLGRPGAGCSTFLRAIANQRGGFAEVLGDVHYGGISAEVVRDRYRGEVTYSPSDDVHFPTLTVAQTLEFALMNKTQKRTKSEIKIYLDAFLKMFGISHSSNTLVGDPYTQGVSGGERKRVSIAETLAAKSSVICWDNSTRGLDASTAVDFVKSLRIMTDVSNRATITTLYQAGEGIYNLMDKVMLIDQGRMIFFGPKGEARQYFLDLGYLCSDRQTTADFLTAITDPVERVFKDGCKKSTPRTAEDLENAFKASVIYKRLLDGMRLYESEIQESDHAAAKEFKLTVVKQKSKYVRGKSHYTVSFPRQVWACTKRQFWLLRGDLTSFYTKMFVSLANALIVGSLFYGQGRDTVGAFSRGGVLFFSILFNGWLQLSEIGSAIGGRSIVARHKEFAFYRPAAVSLARVVADLPLLAIQIIPFSIVIYYLSGLSNTASQFLTFLLLVYISTLNLTALYRMFAAFSPQYDEAIRYSGLMLNIMVIYTGYVISRPQLLTQTPWFGWILYISPTFYAFEAVMANEFYNLPLICTPEQTAPFGLQFTNPLFQTCTLQGSTPGNLIVQGADYLTAAFTYTRSHLWRNFGILLLFTFFYIVVAAIGTELFLFVPAGASLLKFKKTQEDSKQLVPATNASLTASETPDGSDDGLNILVASESVFTFQDIDYTVDYEGGKKQLLHKVDGWVRPGEITALVGASGAGKTTLLNTLSQRNNKIGTVRGEMLVNGHPLGTAFSRCTGFVEQQDIHDETSTIREAFEFSAILRQDRNIPQSEKIEYVDKVLELLELNHLQHCIVGTLDIEQKKRLTIGVELCAKPDLLLFLDEPTSGLDSQSAFNIVRFMRKLANAGQAIICTIHQPSSELIEEFDRILALSPGGNVFYFGPVGKNGKEVVKYFEDRGALCPPNANPAEFVLEVGCGNIRVDGNKIDWNGVWAKSREAKAVRNEISRIRSAGSQSPAAATDIDEREFAASVWTQTRQLTLRVWRNYWRDPSYGYSKVHAFLLNGIFNGFTFWMLGNSAADLTNRMFSAFLVILLPATVINGTVPKFFTNRQIWESRELPSRIYGWIAFTTANIVCEIPYAILSSVIYWVVWYLPVGFPTQASVSGYVFLMFMLFNLFVASWGQWISAFALSYTVIANVIPFFLVLVQLFTGILRTYAQTPVFWRFWLYYLSPVQWYLNGVLGVLLHDVPVVCSAADLSIFNSPPGQTCQSYAQAWLDLPSTLGYLTNPTATSDCGYCPFKVGDDYLATLNISYERRWRSFAIFLSFVLTNYVLVFFMVYFVRLKGYTFGFSRLVRALRFITRSG